MTVEERRQARLAKLKANLVIEHDRDDEILTQHLNAAMDYAGKFQHKNNAYYSTHRMRKRFHPIRTSFWPACAPKKATGP